MTDASRKRVVVVGAGLAGIITAIEFKRRLGIDVSLYEREAGPGGTWRVNTYPGCACDIPSQWYSLSSELNPNWSSAFSKQPEIQAYWDAIFLKYDLQKQTRFNVSFVRADWDVARQLYKIQFESTADAKQRFEVEAEILVSAIGGFSSPLDKPPGLRGIERFQGDLFHSARWNHSVDLKNKRVGVIGNGCSAAQFVPEIAKEKTTSVVNFVRKAVEYPDQLLKRIYLVSDSIVVLATRTLQLAYAYVPFLQRIVRGYLALLLDSRWIFWIMSNVWLRKQAEKQFVAYIRKRAPKKYHDFLIPNYPIGCKRIIVDPGYLKCLHQDNVELVYDPIETITEDGIKCASGKEHQLDVLILGTGFNLSHDGFGLAVHNTDGECLTRQWEKQGGPQAYLGTTIGGFPNFFMLLGPNVATGHTSAIAHIECQVNYTVKVVQKMLHYKADVLELRPEAEKQYNSWLHKKLDNTVWKGGCHSYYQMANGKVIAMWPGTLTYFWWKTLRPNFSHYSQIGGKADIASSERQKTFFKAAAALLGLLAIGARLRSGFSF